jgi:Tol biopolymer transport system component
MSLHPAFSFDGKYLATTCVLSGGAGHKIYIQNSEGSRAREVVRIASPIMSLDGLTWTADGRFLVYAR